MKLIKSMALVLGVIAATGASGIVFLEDYQKQRILTEIKRLVGV